jgi:hypothetical protein
VRNENRKTSEGTFANRVASNDPKARLLNRIDEVFFLYGLRIVEHTRLPIAERHGCHLHPGLLLNEAFDGVGARVAVHTFDFEDGCFHLMLRFVMAMLSLG